MRRLAVVAALMVLAACGGDGGSDDGPLPPKATLRTACPDRGDDLDLKVDVRTAEPPRSQGEVTWHLVLTNDGFQSGTVVFPSGKLGDVVLEQDGDELYRWSRERTFTQQVQCFELRGGRSVRLDLENDQLEFDEGDYELTATVASDPAPAPHRERFTVLPR